MLCFGGQKMIAIAAACLLFVSASSAVGATDFEPPSRCNATAKTIICSHNSIKLVTGLQDRQIRTVLWQVPLGTPPANGWPVVIMFQGSFFTAAVTWFAQTDEPFGAYYQTALVKSLLDGGYAVITPEALYDGTTFWETNIPPFDLDWSLADDNVFMLNIFECIRNKTFGPLDITHMHGTGISSGGYMTSRMAISYTSSFRSLAIESASYAICGGPACVVPELPAGHPPTLFLHGLLDPIVPIFTMEEYYDKLKSQSIPTQKVVYAEGGHQWIPEAPTVVPAWFDQWNK
eukprot:TRINITY_DN8718_c0_g1_i1.p5 TRINITY_DN8718_c0_g1~~TRINITY_DN8718_c0_g1_i1.p5  ORF type:complete len:289 (+),score=59.00 TRINITY_DN8718_c0_g1_i1:1353-2219(+)